MNESRRFNPQKALEVLLYVAQRCPDIYTALKVLYFADKDHLVRHGRLISTDRYVAMRHGPVPSGTYDLIKYVHDDWLSYLPIPVAESFNVLGYDIIPKREPDMDLLSQSDVECLDSSIDKYGRMTFNQLKAISHEEPAFKAADENDLISFESLVMSIPDGELLWDYLISN